MRNLAVVLFFLFLPLCLEQVLTAQTRIVMGLQGVQLSLAELSQIGVKRVSVGSALSRAALGAFLRAAREMREHGTFAFADEVVSYRDISAMFEA